jgi:hypothetical protein
VNHLVADNTEEKILRLRERLDNCKSIQSKGIFLLNSKCMGFLLRIREVEEEISTMQQQHQQPATSRNAKRTKPPKSIKPLFSKIAQKTHPDKSSDKELNALFIKARRAYEENDFFTLMDINNSVFNDNYILTPRESSTLLKSLEEEFTNLVNSLSYINANKYLNGDDEEKDKALRSHQEHLTNVLLHKMSIRDSLSYQFSNLFETQEI